MAYPSVYDSYIVNTYGGSGLNILTSYIPFNEPSGNAQDHILSTTGTIGASITQGATGILPTTDGETCYAIGGSSGGVQFTNNFGGSYPRSYEFWWEPTSSTLTASNVTFILANGHTSATADGVSIYYINSVGFRLTTNSTGSYTHWTVTLAAGTAYHVVIVSDGTGANTNLYQNATLITQISNTTPAVPSSANGSILSNNAGSANCWGSFEKFAVYNAILTPTQITANHNAGLNGPPPSGNIVIANMSGNMQQLTGNIQG